MRRLAVLTSGGDAPGMNAATRAVVRSAVARGFAVAGVYHGYTGLIAGDFRALGARDVGGVLHEGGTFLGTTRCESLKTDAGRVAACRSLEQNGIDALVVIGGNGSQTGAHALADRGVAVVGVASTIDNDLYGTDVSIGATTAVDVALEAIDRLRVTAAAMRRAFLVEVMGRNCGFLALMAGITGGAEAIAIPELDVGPDQIAADLHDAYARGKSHAIAVIAEGARLNADRLLAYFRDNHDRFGFDVRVTKLGHVQRGGAPGAFDRMLGTMLGVAAVDAVIDRRFGVLVGLVNGAPACTPLADVAGRMRPANAALVETARQLAA
jgi:6-phosphofructokinase 1